MDTLLRRLMHFGVEKLHWSTPTDVSRLQDECDLGLNPSKRLKTRVWGLCLLFNGHFLTENIQYFDLQFIINWM